MHILREPSFFSTNNIGAPHGEILALMKPLSRRSFNFSLNSLISAGAIMLGGTDIGWVSGRRSIPKSIYLSGGTPRRYFGNTTGKSLTSGSYLRDGVSRLKSLTRSR